MRHIGIVGAGPAGLAAAWYLREAGYKRLTLLERDSAPGGKCRTFLCRGRPYELGAVMGTNGYRATLDLMRQVGEAPQRFDRPVRAENGRPDLLKRGYFPLSRVFPGYFSYGEAGKLFMQILKYFRLARRYRTLYSPGLTDLPPGLSAGFSGWAETHGMRMFAKMIEIPCTAFGYGYLAAVPAAYILKYMDPSTVLSLLFQQRFFKWSGGAQKLWETVAEGFDVRCGVDIQSVTRGQRVMVTTDAGGFRFDDLILTAPLDEALGYLDARPEEEELFRKIRNVAYFVFICELRGLDIPSGFIPANLHAAREARLMIWSRPWREEPLFLLYAQAQPGMDPQDVLSLVRTDVESMGGHIVRVEHIKKWKYFPHVSTDVLRSGFYERLEGLQGRFRTYYAGEVMSFSSVEHVVRYSRWLVDRFFAGLSSPSSEPAET